jgi:hypothetical protein
MRRAVSASPARTTARGRRAVTPIVRLGITPFTPTPTFSTTVERSCSEQVAPVAMRSVPLPLQATRHLQLDAALSNMRVAVDHAANVAAQHMPNPPLPVKPSAMPRSSSVAPASGGESESMRKLSVNSTPLVLPKDNAFRGVPIIREQLKGRRHSSSQNECSVALSVADPPTVSVPPFPEESAAKTAATPCSARHSETTRRHHCRSEFHARSSSASRLDMNARLTLLTAALPALGCDGALAATLASAERPDVEVHTGATRLRWADNLRRYAWRHVCARCAGSGVVMGIGRSQLHPIAVPGAGAETWGSAKMEQQNPATGSCQRCGEAMGLGPSADNAAAGTDGVIATVAPASESSSSARSTSHQSRDMIGGMAAAKGYGIIGALRSMSAERLRAPFERQSTEAERIPETDNDIRRIGLAQSEASVAMTSDSVDQQEGATSQKFEPARVPDAALPVLSNSASAGSAPTVSVPLLQLHVPQDTPVGMPDAHDSPHIEFTTPAVAVAAPAASHRAERVESTTASLPTTQRDAGIVNPTALVAPGTAPASESGVNSDAAEPALLAEAAAVGQTLEDGDAQSLLSADDVSAHDCRGTSSRVHSSTSGLSFAEEVALAATAAVRRALGAKHHSSAAIATDDHQHQRPILTQHARGESSEKRRSNRGSSRDWADTHQKHHESMFESVSMTSSASSVQVRALLSICIRACSYFSVLYHSLSCWRCRHSHACKFIPYVQEAVVAAIKSRLRALRQASGGSVDLAGVRDRVLDALYKQRCVLALHYSIARYFHVHTSRHTRFLCLC